MRNEIWNASVVVAAAMAAACTGEPADFDGDVEPIGPTVRKQLERRAEFTVVPLLPTGEGSYLTADLGGDLIETPTNVALPVLGGHLTARADRDGYLVVESFSVDLSDVAMGPDAFPPRGLVLTGMQLSLADEVRARPEWGDPNDAVAVVASFDLLFDWAVVLSDGSVHPLATQRVSGIEFDLEVHRRGVAQLEARVGAHVEGHVWHWAQFVEVSNLVVAITAQSAVAL